MNIDPNLDCIDGHGHHFTVVLAHTPYPSVADTPFIFAERVLLPVVGGPLDCFREVNVWTAPRGHSFTRPPALLLTLPRYGISFLAVAGTWGNCNGWNTVPRDCRVLLVVLAARCVRPAVRHEFIIYIALDFPHPLSPQALSFSLDRLALRCSLRCPVCRPPPI